MNILSIVTTKFSYFYLLLDRLLIKLNADWCANESSTMHFSGKLMISLANAYSLSFINL